MEKAASRNDVDGYLKANVEFHEHLVILAGNAKLLLTYRRLANELSLFRRATLAQGDTLAISTRGASGDRRTDRGRESRRLRAGTFNHVMASRERMHRLYAAREIRRRRKRPGITPNR